MQCLKKNDKARPDELKPGWRKTKKRQQVVRVIKVLITRLCVVYVIYVDGKGDGAENY